MALARSTTHTQAADGTFSADGATYWNAVHTNAITGAVNGGIPYFDSTTTEATSALLAQYSPILGGGAGAAPYTDAGFTATGTGATFVATLNGLTVTAAPTFSALTSGRIPFAGTAGLMGDSANLTFNNTGSVTSGPVLQIGSGSTTSKGFVFGTTASNQSGIWNTGITPSATNYVFAVSANSPVLGIPTTGDVLYIYVADATLKFQQPGTAGSGPQWSAGTAASAVSAETITQTWNYNTAAINAVDWTFTDASSHAGTLAWRVRTGAGGATACASLTKAGKLEAVSFRANGSDGVSFGPGLPTSITVVNGIITAAS